MKHTILGHRAEDPGRIAQYIEFIIVGSILWILGTAPEDDDFEGFFKRADFSSSLASLDLIRGSTGQPQAENNVRAA